MAVLTVQPVTRAGLVPSYVAASPGGDTFAPSKNTVLHVKNGGGSPVTVTIVTPKEAFAGAAIEDTAVTVAAGAEEFIGSFPYQHYADPTDGLADVTYSDTTSVTVAALMVSE